MTQQLRKQLFSDTNIGELARDVQQAFEQTPRMIFKTFEGLYTEPMTVLALQSPPLSVELVRVLDLAAQETPVKCGGLCHYVWSPQNGGCKITSIDGMSVAVNGNKAYRFTFRITYEPTAGGF